MKQRKLTQRGSKRREQIVATAITVFGEYGYAGGSIRTIADRVGISHATLLQHFGSKEGLFAAIVAEILESMDGQQPADSPPEVALRIAQDLDGHNRERRAMEGDLTDRPLLGGTSDVPAEYRKMVEEYYKALARREAAAQKRHGSSTALLIPIRVPVTISGSDLKRSRASTMLEAMGIVRVGAPLELVGIAVRDLGTAAVDLDELAAVISTLDLVISVDTAIAVVTSVGVTRTSIEA